LSGVAATFGSVSIAIPFLLDLMRLPHDLFQLFIATGVLNARFGTLLQAMHMLALTLLGTCALTGRLRIRAHVLAGFTVVSIVLLGLTVGGVRALFAVTVDTSSSQADILQRMGPVLPRAANATVYRQPPPARELDPRHGRLQQIAESGVLRVCFRESLPFAYFNAAGELVGMDVEMAHSLARGLRVKLELVPQPTSFVGSETQEALRSGYCDIGMGRSVVTMDGITGIAYATPHLEMTIGFLVRDHRRREFASAEQILSNERLRIAIPNAPYYQRRFERYLPNATFTPVDRVQDFLEDESGRFDAMIYPVEIASTWSLVYPDFGVVVPPRTEKLPMAFRLPVGEPEWESTVNTWVELKKTDGTVDRLYAHWILGRDAEAPEPRWSVVRDVLGWVD
jgi:ABC-type amino acid transport substrate-binding protein